MSSCLRVWSHCNDACKPASVCELLRIESSGPRPWRRRRRLPAEGVRAASRGYTVTRFATQSRFARAVRYTGTVTALSHAVRFANRLTASTGVRLAGPGRRGSAGELRALSGGTGPYAGEVPTGPCATCRRRRRHRRLLPGFGPAGPTVAWTWVAWTCEPGPAVSPLDGGVAGRRSEDGEVAGPRVIASGRARPQFQVYFSGD